jgi:nucleoside-diphosphate-sugar epimerase
MVHVRDTSRAFLTVLRADPAKVSGQIFNVGSDDQNFQILPLARQLAEAAGRTFEHDWYGDPDHRSYRVSFAKIHRVLGYETRVTAADAAREIVAGLESGELTPDSRTWTVEWYKSLIQWNETLKGVVLDDAVL